MELEVGWRVGPCRNLFVVGSFELTVEGVLELFLL